MACPLKVAWDQSTSASPREHSSVEAIGIAAHRAIEMLLRAHQPDAQSAWKAACAEVAATGTDPLADPRANRVGLRLARRYPQLVAFIDGHATQEALVEVDLATTDGRVRGRADLILVGPHPAVIDIKTGVVETAEGVDERHATQVSLYAWLAKETLGLGITEGALFSLRQGLIPIDISPELVELTAARAVQAMEAFNARTPGPQPATPSESECGWCPHVARCDAAWEALSIGSMDHIGLGFSMRGEVTAPIFASASGTAAVAMEAEDGMAHGPMMVADVPMDVARPLHQGDRVALVALTVRSTEPLSLAWREGVSRIAKIG
jgi:hypothetical protein